jgi:hypothetical protein
MEPVRLVAFTRSATNGFHLKNTDMIKSCAKRFWPIYRYSPLQNEIHIIVYCFTLTASVV